MRRFLNTLYVTTQESYLHKKGGAVEIIVGGEVKKSIPMITLDGIVCFGNIRVSPFLLGAAPENNITVSFLSESGEFLARVQGPVAGNVLLRKAQYRASDDAARSAEIARAFVAGKVANQRAVLQRALRDHGDRPGADGIREAVAGLGRSLSGLGAETDLDRIRGIEGEAAGTYFSVFDRLILPGDEAFRFSGRNRRPPLDRVNAMLSFVYTLLHHDMISACEVTGLDPAVGFLHRDRPGRLSLALDLMEEFRAFFADRLVLSLINRGEVSAGQFEVTGSGAVRMDDDARRTVIEAYQRKKADAATHPYLGEKMSLAVAMHKQAALLARHLRGDIDGYPPYIWR